MQLQLSLVTVDRFHEALLVRGEPIAAVDAARTLIAASNAPESLCRDVVSALVQQDERFCWSAHPGSGLLSLTSWETPDPELADVTFVALDLETTGARPGPGKITEVGAVRIRGFQELERFSTLINPMRPIPPMITRITGITQEMVAEAPRIEEVIQELLEFLRGAVLVAHNAPFDLGFLNYELQRLTGRRLGDGAIDTLPLARALAPGLPNYRLGTVADALAAPVSPCHRALADAQAAGHVFVTLAARLQERGITRLGAARSYINPAFRGSINKLHLTSGLPQSPGAYRFFDKEGSVLYVGEANRLREEVRSHLVAGGDRARKVRQTVRLVERIEWNETLTSLEAVVLEQQLILEHRPRFNLHGCRPENYAYLKVGNPIKGRHLYVSTRAGRRAANGLGTGRGGWVLGPFRAGRRLKTALELVRLCYPIRACSRGDGDGPCARGQENACLAPCTGDAQILEAHDQLVAGIFGWIMGNVDECGPDPHARGQELALTLEAERRHEEAQRVREACDDLLNVRRSYDWLREAEELSFVGLFPQAPNGHGPQVRVNVVWQGRLLSAVTLTPSSLESEISEHLGRLYNGSQLRDEPGDGCRSHVQPIAISQKELDCLFAVRRWFDTEQNSFRVLLPPKVGDERQLAELAAKIVAEGKRALTPAVSSQV